MVKATLYIMDSKRYFEGIVDIFKNEVADANAIYITTNKPYQHLINLFDKEGINHERIFFIDCISKDVASTDLIKDTKDCLFVDSPKDITGISLAVSTGLDTLPGEKILLLDSLSTLLVYNESKVIGKFSNFLINKLRVKGVRGVILTLETDMNKEIMRNIESNVDEVKRYG